MKKTDILKEARHSTAKELSGKIADERKKLFSLRQDKILGKLKNIAEIGQIKRHIARYSTILDEKINETLK